MKKFVLAILTSLCIATCGLGLTACDFLSSLGLGSSSSQSQSSFAAGTYKLESMTYTATYNGETQTQTMKAGEDGVTADDYVLVFDNKGNVTFVSDSSSQSGTWTSSGNKISITLNGETYDATWNGSKLTVTQTKSVSEISYTKSTTIVLVKTNDSTTSGNSSSGSNSSNGNTSNGSNSGSSNGSNSGSSNGSSSNGTNSWGGWGSSSGSNSSNGNNSNGSNNSNNSSNSNGSGNTNVSGSAFETGAYKFVYMTLKSTTNGKTSTYTYTASDDDEDFCVIEFYDDGTFEVYGNGSVLSSGSTSISVDNSGDIEGTWVSYGNEVIITFEGEDVECEWNGSEFIMYYSGYASNAYIEETIVFVKYDEWEDQETDSSISWTNPTTALGTYKFEYAYYTETYKGETETEYYRAGKDGVTEEYMVFDFLSDGTVEITVKVDNSSPIFAFTTGMWEYDGENIYVYSDICEYCDIIKSYTLEGTLSDNELVFNSSEESGNYSSTMKLVLVKADSTTSSTIDGSETANAAASLITFKLKYMTYTVTDDDGTSVETIKAGENGYTADSMVFKFFADETVEVTIRMSDVTGTSSPITEAGTWSTVDDGKIVIVFDYGETFNGTVTSNGEILTLVYTESEYNYSSTMTIVLVEAD